MKVRLGNVIEVVQSRDQGLSVRVMVKDKDGIKTATTSTSDLGDDAIERLVTTAVAMAKRTAADPFAGPPEAGFEPIEGAPADLQTWDAEFGALRPGSRRSDGARDRCRGAVGRPALHQQRRR